MTCKTECTQFDLAMGLLIDNGFGGIAETFGLLMNSAMQIELSRHLKTDLYERKDGPLVMPTVTNPRR